MLVRLLAVMGAFALLSAGTVALPLPEDPEEENTLDMLVTDGCGAQASTNRTLEVGEDGDVELAFTVHEPDLEQGETAPLILHSHGWSGARNASPSGLTSDLLDACYGVVSIDMRGHGDSSGQAHVHHPDKEIEDVQAVLDWAEENLDWVAEDETDILVGAIGGSYGGGYQLLTAAFDDRIDAIAPDMTWNDLPYALAPNGAVKSAWVDLLYAAGTAEAELAPFIHQGYAWAQAFNEFPSGDAPGEPDVEAMFKASSPSTYESDITVPTLLIQSLDDTLFNLNQAVWNAEQIQSTGQDDVYVLTYRGGHTLHTGGTLPSDSPVTLGLQPAPADSACTDPDQAIVDWYDWQLKGEDPVDLATVELALDDGATCLELETLDEVTQTGTPSAIEDPVVVPQGAPVPSGYLEAGSLKVTPESPASFTVLDEEQTGAVAGVPTLTGTATVAGEGAIAYVSLVIGDGEDECVANSQVTPLRLDGPAQEESFEIELGGVGVDLDGGEELRLQVSSWDSQFAHNQQRAPGALLLEDLEVHLPAS